MADRGMDVADTGNIDELYEVLFDRNESDWQGIMYGLVKEGKINPWDVDIAILTSEFLRRIKELKNVNFEISGRLVLAAVILLSLKLRQLSIEGFLKLLEAGDEELLLGEGIVALEAMGAANAEDALNQLSGLNQSIDEREGAIPDYDPNSMTFRDGSTISEKLISDRTRKVTVFELVAALNKAMEVEQRRVKRQADSPKLTKPKKTIEIFEKLRFVFSRIISFSKRPGELVEFSKIIPSTDRKDLIWTFVPLLHLETEDKIFLQQEEQFSEIFVGVEKHAFERGIGDIERRAKKEEKETKANKSKHQVY